MNMPDDDCAIDYLLKTYGSVLHINSALAKAEMNIVKSSVDDLIERFNPSNAERFRLAANSAEMAELIHYRNFFKLLQLAITLPVSSAKRILVQFKANSTKWHLMICCH